MKKVCFLALGLIFPLIVLWGLVSLFAVQVFVIILFFVIPILLTVVLWNQQRFFAIGLLSGIMFAVLYLVALAIFFVGGVAGPHVF